MADLLMKFSIEPDLALDAGRTLLLAQLRVQKRHGHRFRALEAKLNAIANQPLKLRAETLGDGTIMILPPLDWIEVLEEARKLGLV